MWGCGLTLFHVFHSMIKCVSYRVLQPKEGRYNRSYALPGPLRAHLWAPGVVAPVPRAGGRGTGVYVFIYVC